MRLMTLPLDGVSGVQCLCVFGGTRWKGLLMGSGELVDV